MIGASHPSTARPVTTEIAYGQPVEVSGVHLRFLTATPSMATSYRWLGIQWA